MHDLNGSKVQACSVRHHNAVEGKPSTCIHTHTHTNICTYIFIHTHYLNSSKVKDCFVRHHDAVGGKPLVARNENCVQHGLIEKTVPVCMYMCVCDEIRNLYVYVCVCMQ